MRRLLLRLYMRLTRHRHYHHWVAHPTTASGWTLLECVTCGETSIT